MRILSILLLLVLIIALLVIEAPTSAQTATPVPIFTGTPGVIIVATAVPTSTGIAPQANGCFIPLTLTVGTDVLLRGGVNVRSAPSGSSPLMNYYPNQVQVHLDGGPVCANGFNWWEISGVGNGGWVIEGQPNNYYLKEAAPPPASECSTPLDTIQVGGQLRTVTGSRVRQSPGNDSLVITVVNAHATLNVIGGPECVDKINWWEVSAPYGNSGTLVQGWLAEGFPTNYFIESVTSQPIVLPCRAPLRLHNGTLAAVTYTDGIPRRLRSAPGSSAPVISNLIDGIEFEVINNDSVCVDGYNWWQVQLVATGTTGWLAEGRPGNYWFDILVN